MVHEEDDLLRATSLACWITFARWSLNSLLLLFAKLFQTNPYLFGQRSVTKTFFLLLWPGVLDLLLATLLHPFGFDSRIELGPGLVLERDDDLFFASADTARL